MNIEEFLELYKSGMIIKEGDDFAIIGLPFFHLGYPEGIAIRLTYKNSEIVVSDCRTTMEYLYDNNVDLDDYSDKLTKIMNKFGLFLDGDVFRKVIHSDKSHCFLFREIGYFIEAITLIAYINL